MSGYTAKVARTKVGIKKPSATFSPCFGGPFLIWHPGNYAEFLAAKIKAQGTRGWLVYTEWSGDACVVGKRINLAFARALIDAILSGALTSMKTRHDPIFSGCSMERMYRRPFRNANPAECLEG